MFLEVPTVLWKDERMFQVSSLGWVEFIYLSTKKKINEAKSASTRSWQVLVYPRGWRRLDGETWKRDLKRVRLLRGRCCQGGLQHIRRPAVAGRWDVDCCGINFGYEIGGKSMGFDDLLLGLTCGWWLTSWLTISWCIWDGKKYYPKP